MLLTQKEPPTDTIDYEDAAEGEAEAEEEVKEKGDTERADLFKVQVS